MIVDIAVFDRHLKHIGHPIVGDLRYAEHANDDKDRVEDANDKVRKIFIRVCLFVFISNCLICD